MPQANLDFPAYIADRTRDFVGREWVFDEIDAWLADPDAPRYFIITGEPGIGKTAISVDSLVHDHVMGTDDHRFPVLDDGQIVRLVILEHVRGLAGLLRRRDIIKRLLQPPSGHPAQPG